MGRPALDVHTSPPTDARVHDDDRDDVDDVDRDDVDDVFSRLLDARSNDRDFSRAHRPMDDACPTWTTT